MHGEIQDRRLPIMHAQAVDKRDPIEPPGSHGQIDNDHVRLDGAIEPEPLRHARCFYDAFDGIAFQHASAGVAYDRVIINDQSFCHGSALGYWDFLEPAVGFQDRFPEWHGKMVGASVAPT